MRRLLLAGLLLGLSGTVSANEVEIINVSMKAMQGGFYVSVTLKHDDTGWEHYADAWQVVDESGKVLGKRVLYHPHENEQPFTRSLRGLKIPSSTRIVYVEAHDKVHGWSPQRVRLDLASPQGERYQIQR
ncbi:MAG: hypothetical protein HUJ29_13025 [Gammaproteobacteria bacterium]|nr:hypothetical protein [Gammaproteobacteria bacterium]